MKRKQGITLTMMVVTIIILIIIAGTITYSVSSTIDYSTLANWVNEISYIQDVVDEQINSTTSLIDTTQTITLSITGLSDTQKAEQFNGESITNNTLELVKLDLGKLKITDTRYGNLETETDVYAMSTVTGRVYYVEGIEVTKDKYYSITDALREQFNLAKANGNLTTIVFVPSKIGYTNEPIAVTVKVPNTYTDIVISTSNDEINIGSQVVKEKTYEYVINGNNIVGNYTVTVTYNDGTQTLTSKYDVNGYDITAPVISPITSENYVYKGTETSVLNYITNITATDESGIKTVKYEAGKIEEAKAKEHFKENGKPVIKGRINLDKDIKEYTIYAEDNAGNYAILTFDLTEQSYAIYSATDNSLRFIKTDRQLKSGDTYNGREATQVYTGFENEAAYTSQTQVPWYNYRTNITSVIVEDAIAPVSTAYWFYECSNCSNLDLTKLNTSKATSMKYMFGYCGNSTSVTSFKITGTDEWSTSNVTSMESMFRETGKNATTWSIGNLSKWDTGKVTTMFRLFSDAGYKATKFDIGNLDSWNVSKVTTMQNMFSGAGYKATKFNIGKLDNWNTASVTSMNGMFKNTGYSVSEWNIGNLDNWNTAKVTLMGDMFYSAGYSASEWNIGKLDNWNTSKVKRMASMFQYAGHNATKFDIGNIGGWNTASVTNMYAMFGQSGFKATTWNVGDLSGWNTSNVTNMANMFIVAGYNADYSLDLSGWTVTKVTSYADFNYGAASKITPPKFS